MTTREHTGRDSLQRDLIYLVENEELGTLASEARTTTKEYLAEGYEREELLGVYKSVIGELYSKDLDEQAEELLEVMAELEGFCSPHARL